MDSSALASIERKRVELEDNITKLRKALRHWQTLEIDYEGLREEFLGLPEDASPQQCLRAANDSKPELVDEKELQELLTDTKSKARRPAQLVDLLSKRVDYVTRNVETIRKQLSDAEKKRNALLLAEEPDHRDEAGLPLSEIIEELDESGNVTSSKVQNPGSEAPQLLESLRKAGVKDLKEANGTITKATHTNAAVDRGDSDSDSNEDVANLRPHSESTVKIPSGQNADTSSGLLEVQPGDTPEEAGLRRDMLDYSKGLDEVGAIVAELELEEERSDISYDEDEVDDFDTEADDDEDFENDSEDDTGKSKLGLSLSRGYQNKMQELQEKLGLQNVGPEPDAEAATGQTRKEQRPSAAEAARKAALERSETSKKSSLKTAAVDSFTAKESSIKKKAGKKKVAFASGLDITTEESPRATLAHKKPPARTTKESQERPISDSIVEREAVVDEVVPAAPATPIPAADKPSRFKAARQSQPQTPMFSKQMEFPLEKTVEDASAPRHLVATKLVERPSTRAPKAPDPDGFSDQDHQREIAREYEQHRIKRVLAQEGRFLGDAEEGEITPLEDEETGRRVSRFKAARVKR